MHQNAFGSQASATHSKEVHDIPAALLSSWEIRNMFLN